MKKIITLLALFSITVSAQGTFTDSRDGKKYKTIKIGEQTWMAENLNYDAKGSKCYDNKPANCTKYGRLYDGKTATAVCPKGWHLPSKAEWNALDKAVGGEEVAGKKLKAGNGWNNGGNGTDNYDFSALPGGGFSDGGFRDVGDLGAWWNASDNVYACTGSNSKCDNGAEYYWSDGIDESFLFSVRCLQN